MNRVEFMRQLESLLQNISPAERESAIQYYNDYFDDAGAENEQDVIEALGNPAKVAENIRRDLYGSGYGDNTFQKSPVGNRAVIQYQQVQKPKEEGKLSTGTIVLIVVLCILASPFILGVGTGIFGLLIGIVTAWFGTIFSAGIAALVLFVVMIVLIIVGIICIAYSPLTGLAIIGGGMVCGGIGILFLMLTVAMAGIATPTICRGVIKLFGKVTNKKKTA